MIAQFYGVHTRELFQQMAHSNFGDLRIIDLVCEDIGAMVGIDDFRTYHFLDDNTAVEQKEALKLNDFEKPCLWRWQRNILLGHLLLKS